jgi:hypothetical protein
MGGLEKITK